VAGSYRRRRLAKSGCCSRRSTQSRTPHRLSTAPRQTPYPRCASIATAGARSTCSENAGSVPLNGDPSALGRRLRWRWRIDRFSAGHLDQGAIAGQEQPDERGEREAGEGDQRIPPPVHLAFSLFPAPLGSPLLSKMVVLPKVLPPPILAISFHFAMRGMTAMPAFGHWRRRTAGGGRADSIIALHLDGGSDRRARGDCPADSARGIAADAARGM
jgi:hypothetical protein